MSSTRVVAVLVSFNREELLRRAVESICRAVRLPDALVIVDNASTDGSVDYLRSLQLPCDYELVELTKNTGGAGGFTVGMAHALANHRPDLLWIMDDDTEPHRETLSEALELWQNYPAAETPALIASRVLWTDGREHPMNSPRTRVGASAAQKSRAAKFSARPIRSASFVSLFVSAEAIRQDGLPIVDYFLWNDDFEFTARLARHRTALASEKSVVSHHTKVFDSNTVDIGERFFFEVRNKIWTFSRSSALTTGERLLYGGSSVRRWFSMVRRSSSRAAVLKAGWRGLRDGLLSQPRSNEQALAGVHQLPAWKLQVSADQVADFSVLIPVYIGDEANRFRRALDSVTIEQHRQPAEVVIVQDGPVDARIAEQITEAEARLANVKVVRLPQAGGLARALDAGLAECSHEFVARMDADDVSRPERFELQLPYLESGYDIIGSALEEIAEDESNSLAYRPVPLDQQQIFSGSSFRSPFHHPTVVYRKSAVLEAGGYGAMASVEDYWLWLRMLHRGAKAANLSQPLLKYRVSAGAYHRRGGKEMFSAELRLQGKMLKAGYIGPLRWFGNVLVRGGYRLVPTSLRKIGYRGAFTHAPSAAGRPADSPER
ncbi:glycosyltransferase [Psychromicrobium lacuslunae]|uniref:Glycosyl transferase n=1 Tax=Psychromicrobium lacuslunae TaxID=1618207 RepID=A0A0D4BZ09_9MICC|nr:glycosyltransferase [Psychromicrobium lacuslunae]AJT41351.1 glycosyl transferase [Psychromicrobium lacuslunae]